MLKLSIDPKQQGQYATALEDEDEEEWEVDEITAYLSEGVLKSSTVTKLGGVMKFWHGKSAKCPRLAKMGQDYCSAPGM
jgi:hAT family C-terminal dimerisation region